MVRHKRVLIAVRLVFLVLIGSMALPGFLKGAISPVLPTLLAAYFVTNLAMVFEKHQAFFRQRVQAFLLIFDIFVLVLSMAMLEQYRQELFLAMFLVVLLASAGQRLTVSIGGFVAVAAFYVWFSLNGPQGSDPEAAAILTTGLPVLLVVAIYVGYVTESVARERRNRLQMEDRLHKELRGMNRFQSLSASCLTELDADRLFVAVSESACEMIDAAFAGVLWLPKGAAGFELSASPEFPPDAAGRWKAATPETSPAGRALREGRLLRLSAAEADPALADAVDEILLAPFVDRVGGLQGCLVIACAPPHEHLAPEEEAAKLLVQQAGLLVENAALYRMLTQTRDTWQAAFQSIPTPVVIVDGRSRILQVNPAFLALGDFDLADLVGTPLGAMMEGAALSDGRPLAGPDGTLSGFAAARITIPRLHGEFDVSRAPYAGSADGGSVWVLRKLSADVAAP